MTYYTIRQLLRFRLPCSNCDVFQAGVHGETAEACISACIHTEVYFFGLAELSSGQATC